MTETYQERAEKDLYPIQYRIFKGMTGKFGALRFNFKKAYSNTKNKDNSGVLFLEMTPTEGKNNYQWETKKIVISLNLTEIGNMIQCLQAPSHPDFYKNGNYEGLKIVHDRGLIDSSSRNKNLTYLTISKPEGNNSFWFNMVKTENGETTVKVNIPVSVGESIVIRKLLETAIPSMLAWS
jgi:hypothetical protein